MTGEIVLLEASKKYCYLHKSNRLNALPRALMKNHECLYSVWNFMNTNEYCHYYSCLNIDMALLLIILNNQSLVVFLYAGNKLLTDIYCSSVLLQILIYFKKHFTR